MRRTFSLIAAVIAPLAVAAVVIFAMVISASDAVQERALIKGQFFDRADSRSASPIVARA